MPRADVFFLQGVGEFASITPSADGTSVAIAFKDRPTAEAFVFGPKDIPGLGRLDFSWLPNPPPSSGPAAVSSTAGEAALPPISRDGDTEMGEAGGPSTVKGGAAAGGDGGGGGSGPRGGRVAGVAGEEKEEKEGVDYDVAEEDERWMIS